MPYPRRTLTQLLTLLALLLALLSLTTPSHAQPEPLAANALPPQLAQVVQLEPSTELIQFKALNPAQQIEIRRTRPGQLVLSVEIFTGRDNGYLGVLVEWYSAPRPPAGTVYFVTEHYYDGSAKEWGPYTFDPQAAQVGPEGPREVVYLPALR